MVLKNSCFESDCNCKTSRIHIPVADKCRANCYYCQFRINSNISNLHMPGHSNYIAYGADSMKKYLSDRLLLVPDCMLVGVSGPGDILTSRSQLNELVKLMNASPFNSLAACICTNGWDFDLSADLLDDWENLKYITLTINSLNPQICSHIYIHPDEDASFFAKNIDSQMRLLKWANSKNIIIKINTVLSEYNSDEVIAVWSELDKIAAIHIFNLLPMQGQELPFAKKQEQMCLFQNTMSEAESLGFNLKRNCKHCRSDSYGRW